MTNHRPRLAGAIPSEFMHIYVHYRLLDLRIVFEKVKSLRDLQYQGIHLISDLISNLISEVERIVFLPDGSIHAATHRAFMKYRRLQIIVDELESPSGARHPLSNLQRTKFAARICSGAADEI